MNTKNKIERIVARNPELKETLTALQVESENKIFHKIVDKKVDKAIIIGKTSEKYARYFQLAAIINYGFIHITQVTTVDLLDAYVDEEHPSLSSIVDDMVMIKDSRAFVPNKQKSNLIMQVFEQNERCIYYYRGSVSSFKLEHQALEAYAQDSGIAIITPKDKQVSEI